MMARTTSSSISVNPRRFIGQSLPILVQPPVDALAGRPGVDVEHVCAFGGRIRRACVAALAPRLAERVGRDAAQEVDLLVLRAALVLHAFGQLLETLRVARLAGAAHDAAVVGGLLVGVEPGADFAQRTPQVLLFRALHHQLVQRQRGRRENRDDRDRDDELDQREALHLHSGGLTPPKGTWSAPLGILGWPWGGGVCAGTTGCGKGIGDDTPPGEPVETSVPAANSVARASGRTSVRTRRGVISSTISVLILLSCVDENRRPRYGRSPIPGTRSAVLRSSSLIRPARIWVSPSRSRSVVAALRVPIW